MRDLMICLSFAWLYYHQGTKEEENRKNRAQVRQRKAPKAGGEVFVSLNSLTSSVVYGSQTSINTAFVNSKPSYNHPFRAPADL
jgi:hypothetical protein